MWALLAPIRAVEAGPPGPGKEGTGFLWNLLHLLPVVWEEEWLPHHFWKENLMGWVKNINLSAPLCLPAAWWTLAALPPPNPRPKPARGGPSWGAGAPRAHCLHPGPQHAKASAPRGYASQTHCLISFLPPTPDVITMVRETPSVAGVVQLPSASRAGALHLHALIKQVNYLPT